MPEESKKLKTLNEILEEWSVPSHYPFPNTIMTKLGVHIDLSSVDKEYAWQLLQSAYPSVDFNSLRLVSLADRIARKRDGSQEV